MCGIAGAQNPETVRKLMESIEHRGSSSKIRDSDDIVLGHFLHSVVGEVKQPLEGKGVLIANCEIYNWKELATDYDLDVENDAELLL